MIAHSPLHGSQRAGLPHWALASGDDAKSPQGIGVSNARGGQPTPDEPPHPLPSESPALPAAPQRAVPQSTDLKAKRDQGWPVHRDPVVPQVPSDDRPQPRAHHGNRGVHASPQLGFDLAQLRLQPPPDRLPHHREPSIPLLPADMREAQEVERLRLPLAGALPVFGRERPEFQQPRLLSDRAELRRVLRWRRAGCGLPLLLTASALRSRVLSRLNTRPARPPVNASPSPLRAPAHDPGPVWVAGPSPYDSFIRNTPPV